MAMDGYTPGPRQAKAEVPGDNMDLSAGGVKFDAGKVRFDLVPWESIYAEAAVYTYGAIKYDDWNWAKGMRKGRVVAALMRHTMAYMMGEYLDPESGLPHTWHMRCCTGMLVGIEMRGVAEEDRAMHLDAYAECQRIFAGMKDPADTVKNGGGSLLELDVDAFLDGHGPDEEQQMQEACRQDQEPVWSLEQYIEEGATVGSVFEVVGWDEWANKHHLTKHPPQMPDQLEIGDHVEIMELADITISNSRIRFMKLPQGPVYGGRAKAKGLLVVPI